MQAAKLLAFLLWPLFYALIATAAQADFKSSVKCLQAQLNTSGFAAGPVDGLFGRRTHRALLNFVRKHGMPAEPSLIKHNASRLLPPIGADQSGSAKILACPNQALRDHRSTFGCTNNCYPDRRNSA